MAVTLIQTNFTAGEISPEARGRVDIAKYNNGASMARNVVIQVLGGAKGRGGMRFVAKAKHADKSARLIPYIFNRDQAYVLEFGDGYIRVFYDRAQIGLDGAAFEIASPYTLDMLNDLDYVQGADTMFIAHQQVPLHRLRRFAHDDWRLEPVPFKHVPASEIGIRPNVSLTLSDVSEGNNRSATASAGIFLPADIGREIVHAGGTAVIISIGGSTAASVNITSRFSAAVLDAGEWTLAGSPSSPCKPSKKGTIGEMIELTLGAVSMPGTEIPVEFLEPGHKSAVFDMELYFKATGHNFQAGQRVLLSGFIPAAYNGTYTVKYTASYFVTTTSLKNAGTPLVLGVASLVDATGVGGWRDQDIGAYVRLNGGIVRIVGITDAVVARAEVVKPLEADNEAFIGGWSLEHPVWNEHDGYPRTATLNAQRLLAAASPSFPQTIWGSEIGNPLAMVRDVEDDSGFSFAMDSREINPIAFLPSNKALMALTHGGEFTIYGGQDKPITPTNIQADRQSTFGCSSVRPILIGNQLFFVQRDGRVLRAASYSLESDSYLSPSISKLSQHLMEPGVVDMAYQQHPYSCIWMVRSDGRLVSITIDNEENVVAWSWHETEGHCESVACIPGLDGSDQVWVSVRREVNGGAVRYIERLDDAVHTDSCVTGEAELPTETWGGLGHLTGMTVRVVADGIPISPVVVAEDGSITLERKAQRIEAGLSYTPRVDMLTPELPGPFGSAQGNNMRISECSAYLLNTVGCKINDELIEFRRLDAPILDRAVEPFTGTERISILGWERGGAKISIEQPLPLPFHLLAVIRKFTSNG